MEKHCSYPSTRHLLITFPTQGETVLQGPGDDAAIVAYSEDIALAVGMESHNQYRKSPLLSRPRSCRFCRGLK